MAEQGPLSNHTLGGKYVLGELLGQGGFGAVYQARHSLLNRQQAIKILLEQHFTSPKFRERFLREAQTLAALDHPNIVHVDDFGFEDNRAYLVMPYIGGGSLQSLLRQRGPLSLEEATRSLEQICAALDYAHARNIVHLDLKPLNLLLHEDGRLLLSDFGLAHLMEQGAIEGSTSLQFGTPSYMAPEHLQGQPERRSDLYALGIMLYQMLTLRVPFEGSNAAAIMLKHLTEPPPPLRTLRPDLPPDLDSVLATALAKQPEARFQSAGALLAAFKAAFGGRASLPEIGISDAPTRFSTPPLAQTLRVETPPAAWGDEAAVPQAATWVEGLGQKPVKKEPGRLLSKKSIRSLSLSILALNFISLILILAGLSVVETFRNVFWLLTFFIWVVGLIRANQIKTLGWFVVIFISLPLAYFLQVFIAPLYLTGLVGIGPSSLIADSLVPVTILLSTRRSVA